MLASCYLLGLLIVDEKRTEIINILRVLTLRPKLGRVVITNQEKDGIGKRIFSSMKWK
ncbi:hypothetical protein ACQCWA_22625 [Rossellomorea aquimaris]